MLTTLVNILVAVLLSGTSFAIEIGNDLNVSDSVPIVSSTYDTVEVVESTRYFEDWPCWHDDPYQIYKQYMVHQTDPFQHNYCLQIEGAYWTYHWCDTPFYCECTAYSGTCQYTYF